MEAARRRLLVQLVMQLVRQGDRWRHKVLQLGRPWIVVGHRRRRLEPRRLRWLVREVRVLWRRSWQQARLQVQRWRLMEDRHRRRVVQRVQRPTRNATMQRISKYRETAILRR